MKRWHTRSEVEGWSRAPVRPSIRGALEQTFGGGDWTLVEFYEMQGDRAVIAELRIFPAIPDDEHEHGGDPRMIGERSDEDTVPSGGVTARLLRRAKIGRVVDVIADQTAWHEKFLGEVPPDEDTTAVLQGRGDPQRPGRPRTSDLYYAELANRYAELCAAGVRAPAKRIAEELGDPDWRVRSRIRLARDNGFLSSAQPGKRGGLITNKTRDLLREAKGGDDG